MKILNRIIASIFTAASLTSCGLAILDGDAPAEDKGEHSIVISGTVSDSQTNGPIVGIKITMNAYGSGSARTPLETTSTYTGINGIYEIKADGFTEAIRCVITAESPEDSFIPYEKASQEINVNWSGPSYASKENTFFANDCNFKLKRIR